MASTAKHDWPKVRLGDVCHIEMGQAPKSEFTNERREGLPLIAGAGDFTSTGLSAKKYTSRPTKTAEPGDLVLSIRATIGPFRTTNAQCVLGRGVAGLRAENGLEANFLPHLLTFLTPALQKKGKGATFLQVSKKDISELEFRLPPLDEQRRIAAILDDVHTILRQADDMTRLFREVIISELKHVIVKSTACKSIPLGELAQIKTGNSPSRKKPEYFGSEIEWIKSDNLGKFRPTTASEGLTSLGKQQSRVVPADSILVTCIAGSLSSIGKCSITDREVAFNQQINAILPNDSFDPYFLYWQLVAEPELVRAAATDGMKNLVSKSKFSGIKVTILPIAEQRCFSEVAVSIALVEQRCLRKVELLQELQMSLSVRAFQGEL